MPLHLPAASHASQPIVPAGHSLAGACYFNLLRLKARESVTLAVPGYELLCVVLSGRATIAADGQVHASVGGRPDIWSGPADSVYAGTVAPISITGEAPNTEVAVAGGRCDARFAPFRIAPSDVRMVEVGSAATHSRRRIFHILGQEQAGRSGRLLVSELYADPGCWSGYPPHKHDTEAPPEETEFQEIYHYRFRPETGFGAQYCYDATGAGMVAMTRHGDTFIVDRGYHPTVTSPGHESYLFTILVGRHQRSLVQFFEPAHRPLLETIPGIQAMRDRFK